jgi:hypothetical protein
MAGRSGRGENEGSTKNPATETRTTAIRGSAGNWRVATVQGRFKQATMEEKEKLANLTMQGQEEITTTEAAIIKEVEGAKVVSQNFI